MWLRVLGFKVYNSKTVRCCAAFLASCRGSHNEWRTIELKMWQMVHDCFSRINTFLSHLNGGVKQYMELLKVASQILDNELTDTCLQCLSVIPWSFEEEQVGEFCVSGNYFGLGSDFANDLRWRVYCKRELVCRKL